jgi:hypothetical protein
MGVGVEGDERMVGVTGIPHDAQKALSLSNFAPHFTQYDIYFTLIEFNS